MSGAEAAIIPGATKAVLGVLFMKSTVDFFCEWNLDTALLDKLKIQVNSTLALFRVAETKQIENNSTVNSWLKDVRFAIYDTEDLLEKILIEVHRVNNRLSSTPIATKNVFGKLKSKGTDVVEKLDYKRKDIVRRIHPYKKTRETQMTNMIEKLKSLASLKGDLGLEKNNELIKFKESRVSTSYVSSESEIIGREVIVKEIVELINVREGTDDSLRVITITGMGGAGKTTVASMVYCQYETPCQDGSKIFEVTVWIFMSDSFEITHVIRSILEQITKENITTDNLQILQQKLREVLNNKRFLIVLDDAWHSFLNKWETLKAMFSVGARGSIIIVTTRDDEVARIASDSHDTFMLNRLTDDESWLLFQKLAFRMGDSSAFPRLEKIGKEIVAKCKGLPLAVKMVGKLLLLKENDEEEWDFVLRSKIWNSANDILPSLWLSYYHLPIEVKPCFAYLSIFPKGHIFSMEKMVMLWIAEGFVQCMDEANSLCEQLARTYFKHLCSTFFIQRFCSWGSGFVMHDLVHDLAEHVSEGLLVNLKNPDPKSRRVYYIQGQDEKLLNSKLFQKLTGLRTFRPVHRYSTFFLRYPFFDKKLFDGLLSKFKLLRVLSLEGYDLSELPEAISDMELLKYLNLAGTKIEHLPDWICQLYSLQILNISNCYYLKGLPTKFCDLVNLRHLIAENIVIVQMPDGIGRMINLQTLPEYKLGKGKSKQMREFKDLCNLCGTLRISKLNNVDDPKDVEGSFENKRYLKVLNLSWKRNTDRDTGLDESVLDALQSHISLKGLTISWYGGKSLSKWIVGGSQAFTHIVSLCLENCFNCKTLPSLGNLVCLEELRIDGMDSLESLDAEFYGNSKNAFKALETLEIFDMKCLKTWYIPIDGEGGFYSLKELHISDCPMLTEIPYCFPSLVKLYIKVCNNLVQFEIWEAATSQTTFGPSLRAIDIYDCNMLKEIPKNFVNLVNVAISKCNSLVSMPRLHNVQKVMFTDFDILKVVVAALRNEISDVLDVEASPGNVNVDLLIPPLELVEASLAGKDAGDELVLRQLDKQSELFIRRNDDLDYYKKLPIKRILTGLTTLHFSNCGSFQDVELPSTIRSLYIRDCDALTTIPDQFLSGCQSLQFFFIFNCPSLKYLPSIPSTSGESTLRLTLEDLPALESLPDGLHSSTALKGLSIRRCLNLVLPQEGFPVKLESLQISWETWKGRLVPENTYLRSISEVKLSNLTSLTDLKLEGFDGTFLQDSLPKSIENLLIENFPRLESLSGVAPSLIHLSILTVENCPLVTEKNWLKVLKLIPEQCLAYKNSA